MADGGWVSSHLFCHGDLDALLARAIRPLVADASTAGKAHGFFFLRHWDGGPHLRLRLLAGTGADRPVLRQLIRERCGGYLREHPAAAVLTQRDYATTAAMLARREGADGYLPRLQPDGQVRFIPYRPEHARYGDGAAMRLIETHFQQASEIALSLVSFTAPEQRRTAAFCMLLLTWLTTGPPADGPVSWLPPAGLTARDYAGRRQRLITLAGRCQAVMSCPDGPGALPAWYRSIRSLTRPGIARFAAPPPTVVNICAHLMCNRLGLPLAAEARLRYLAGRTLADQPDWPSISMSWP